MQRNLIIDILIRTKKIIGKWDQNQRIANHFI